MNESAIRPSLSSSRSALGLVLQQPSVRPWQRSIVWNAVVAVLETHGRWVSSAASLVQEYVALDKHIRETNLATDIENPPLLNVSRQILLI